MRQPLTFRQSAEAIEQFGDDLAALSIAFTKLCDRMGAEIERVNALPHQDKLDLIAEDFRKLGDEMCREADAAEEADDRRRDNSLASDFRRIA